jgi:hypothetical protein
VLRNRLRRKGHLKEQDAFISLLLRMHEMHSCLEVMTKMERWITEHRRDPRGSQLSRMVPSVVSSCNRSWGAVSTVYRAPARAVHCASGHC